MKLQMFALLTLFSLASTSEAADVSFSKISSTEFAERTMLSDFVYLPSADSVSVLVAPVASIDREVDGDLSSASVARLGRGGRIDTAYGEVLLGVGTVLLPGFSWVGRSGEVVTISVRGNTVRTQDGKNSINLRNTSYYCNASGHVNYSTWNNGTVTTTNSGQTTLYIPRATFSCNGMILSATFHYLDEP